MDEEFPNFNWLTTYVKRGIILRAAATHALMSQRRDIARTARHKRIGVIQVNSADAANDKRHRVLLVKLDTYVAVERTGLLPVEVSKRNHYCME